MHHGSWHETFSFSWTSSQWGARTFQLQNTRKQARTCAHTHTHSCTLTGQRSLLLILWRHWPELCLKLTLTSLTEHTHTHSLDCNKACISMKVDFLSDNSDCMYHITFSYYVSSVKAPNTVVCDDPSPRSWVHVSLVSVMLSVRKVWLVPWRAVLVLDFLSH